jgi:hypothetical protein
MFDFIGLSLVFSFKFKFKFKTKNKLIGECPICLNNNQKDLINNTCSNKHVFHSTCLQQWVDHKGSKTVTCPLCRENLF